MGAQSKIAVIESDADLQRLVTRILHGAGCAVETADNLDAGKNIIADFKPQVVVCGLELDGGSGVQLLQSLHDDAEKVGAYRILLCSMGNRELANAALEAMADDYLPTSCIHTDLVARVRVGLRMWQMHAQLRNAATTDGLTGLCNHHHFHQVLHTEMERSRRYGHPLSLIILDIDFFKAINDTFGHPIGNAALQEVARTLRENIRDVDTVGRIGGEEFAIIVPESNSTDAALLAERIRIAMPKTVATAFPKNHEVTASFGIADSDCPKVINAATLLDLADRALYAAKRLGRNQVKLGKEIDEGNEIEAVIEHNEVDWLRRRLAMLTAKMQDVYVQSVATLLKALDEKDPYAARHSVNVAHYSEAIARELGCSKAACTSVYNAALLHDVGKVGVPDNILMKRTPLTPLEHMVIEQVPLIGTRIVNHMRILESEIQIIRYQREFFDGSGTRSGLAGDEIPIGSRILMAADAFDAMTTDRVYRIRKPAEEALTKIRKLAGKQFDPTVASTMQRVFVRNRAAWESRIRDAIVAARVPSPDTFAFATEGFNLGTPM
ncbi:MAG: GGDEF/HDGYP domain-containing response regulator [Planctomycetota bacterium]|jgi:diguanylate cyclase (GGDEF)-like protein